MASSKRRFFQEARGKGNLELSWIRSDEVGTFWGMPHGLATTLQVIIGTGVGAGAVTFFLNFWKAEWDFRRAKLEELYAATHRYTISAFEVCSNVTIGKSPDERKQEEVKIDFERVELLVNLYFPQLQPTFEGRLPSLMLPSGG